MTNLIDNIGNEQSGYCYPNTDVLVNKKGIMDADELENEEKILTVYKLAILNSGDYSSINMGFDVNHYLSIHKFLFDELYEFAGQYRTENIKKGKWFCDIQFMSTNLNETLRDMNSKIKLVNSRDRLVLFLAKYFLDLNIIHPFREGNGRTLREYLREYVEYINIKNGFNFELDYKLMTDDIKEKYLEGSIMDDRKIMMEVFDSLIKEKEYENEKGNHR